MPRSTRFPLPHRQHRVAFAAVAGILLSLPATAVAQAPGAPVLQPPTIRPCTPYGLDLRWSAASAPAGVARYEVTVAAAGQPPRVATTVPAPTPQAQAFTVFLDGDATVPLRGGATYVIGVRAVDAAGVVGPADEEPVTMPADFAAKVDGFSAAYAGPTVALSWQATAACGFTVFSPREGNFGQGQAIASASEGATSARDDAPLHGPAEYTLVALNRRGLPGPGTIAVAAEPLPLIPAQPTCAWRQTTLSARYVKEGSMASLCLLNHERVRQGLQPLWVDGRLQTAAERHAQDEVTRRFFAHTNPDGCNPSCRAQAAGYPQGAGENISGGRATAEAVIAGWLASPGHRSNILGNYRTVGSGTAIGGQYGREWVHTFGFVGAPFSAVSGLEPQFQGAADPSGGAAVAPRMPTTPRPAAAARKSAPALRLRSVNARSGRRLQLSATLARAADGGRVRIVLRARGRSWRSSVIVRRGQIRFARAIPRMLRGFRRATLTVTYTGSAKLSSATVRRTLRR